MLHYSGGPATKVPTGDSLKEEIHGFEHKWGVPQSASAVDRTHIPIVTHCHPLSPSDFPPDYINHEGGKELMVDHLY